MLTEDLRSQLSALRRGQAVPGRETRRETRPASRALADSFPEGEHCDTPLGKVFVCRVPLERVFAGSQSLTKAYHRAFLGARQLAKEEALPDHLAPLAQAEVESTALIDTETAGWQGRPLFLLGLLQCLEGELVLSQYFAQDYTQEAALLGRFAEILPEIRLLVSFNGKAFDWPFVRDRMVYHRLSTAADRADFAHLDLLHSSRRRWRALLPNCRLQTLERYLSGRWRSGDIPGAEIPQRYHDYVREQDARLISPIFHHNRLDLITMVEIMVALISDREVEPRGVGQGERG